MRLVGPTRDRMVCHGGATAARIVAGRRLAGGDGGHPVFGSVVGRRHVAAGGRGGRDRSQRGGGDTAGRHSAGPRPPAPVDREACTWSRTSTAGTSCRGKASRSRQHPAWERSKAPRPCQTVPTSRVPCGEPFSSSPAHLFSRLASHHTAASVACQGSDSPGRGFGWHCRAAGYFRSYRLYRLALSRAGRPVDDRRPALPIGHIPGFGQANLHHKFWPCWLDLRCSYKSYRSKSVSRRSPPRAW